ncbi:MAG TPA: sulfur carrier protein ThiS [Bryobacteraceae bacterium]|nr:sulfur carrier protein ThiS [Bryobacteraceae bacterium]
MDTESINVQVNGEARRVPAQHSVAALLAWLEVPSERVAVELNKAIVRKRDWTTTRVEGEACIEIVEFVGGG